MRKAIILMSLLLFLSACGSDLAPTDSTVTGPDDETVKLPLSTTASSVFYRPLDFVVRNEGEIAMPDVEIEFFSTGTAVLTDIDGNVLATPTRVKSKTDDRGIGRISILISVPGCTGTADVEATGGVIGTVGSASHSFQSIATRSCGTE